MSFRIKSFSSIFYLSMFFISRLEGSEDQKKKEMIEDLGVIKHHLEVGYAPMDWKKSQLNWTLDEEFEKSKNKILETPCITTKQFQQIVQSFLHSTQDYHVNALFVSTETASLPFSVKGVKGRYFIDWVDTLRLPPSYYGINIGDELLEFDGKPVDEVIEELKKDCHKSNPSTDQTFAEIKLTFRSGETGDIVPKGPISILVESHSHKIKAYQLQWLYQSESITNTVDFFSSLEDVPLFPQKKMTGLWFQLYSEKKGGQRNGGLGAFESFVPRLGILLWTKKNEEKKEESSSDLSSDVNWNAYIYLHPDKKYIIGYIRIPHYLKSQKSANAFGKIINFMEKNTDALVIDQLNNTGGLAFFQYNLASMLAVKPLEAPYHQLKLTQKEILEAYQALKIIHLVDESIDENFMDENDYFHLNQKSELDENTFKLNYQNLLFLKSHYQFILNEWNEGRFLTRPTPVLGMDKINPHPLYQYTKPIVVLINEMDFSGGDILPATLQDNKRAILFGSRTAGAGGCVEEIEFPNRHGIASFSYTTSIAERSNSEKIENIGVIPDVEYELTIEDVRKGYQDYKKAVNKTVKDLLENLQTSDF